MNIKLLIIAALFIFLSTPSISGELHTDDDLTINTTTINKVINNTTNITNKNYQNYSTTSKYNAQGQALALGVAAIDCSFATKRWQAGVGFGYFDGVGAPVAGICKKFNNTLIKFTVGRENESTGGNIGVMFPLN